MVQQGQFAVSARGGDGRRRFAQPTVGVGWGFVFILVASWCLVRPRHHDGRGARCVERAPRSHSLRRPQASFVTNNRGIDYNKAAAWWRIHAEEQCSTEDILECMTTYYDEYNRAKMNEHIFAKERQPWFNDGRDWDAEQEADHANGAVGDPFARQLTWRQVRAIR